MILTRWASIVLLAIVMTALLSAAEKTIQLPPDHPFGKLKSGAGVEVVEDRCGVCHSTDYIVTQPRRDAKQWSTEVDKMIRVFGAPVKEREVKIIVDYLVSSYGPRQERPTRKAK
ncbi:MAG: cytochrome c [Acidobacteriia bacterium]|nr:cytochrome c [Terriglobia bacterium]